ncbi:MAG: cytochrome b [Oleispira sp.]|jgi:cytochrome b561|nr:cytochrome b [Oleispira sp.]
MVKNSKSSYGWIAIVLHWLMAIGIFFLFGLGLYMVELTYYDTWYRGSLELHKSLGLTLLLIWIARIAWRWLNTSPKMSGTKFEKKAAHTVHAVLYLLMLALMVTGYLISTADGRGIEVFSLIEVPAMSISIENQEDIAGDIHWAIAWVLMFMVGLHSLAAIKHQLINKDGTLMKMIRPKADS